MAAAIVFHFSLHDSEIRRGCSTDWFAYKFDSSLVADTESGSFQMAGQKFVLIQLCSKGKERRDSSLDEERPRGVSRTQGEVHCLGAD